MAGRGKRKALKTAASPSKKAKTNAENGAASVPPSNTNGRWTPEEDKQLRAAVASNGAKNWKHISQVAFGGSRSDVQCLHRWQKVLKPGLHKGPWSKDEDRIVSKLIAKHGIGNIKWSQIAQQLQGRLGKQCRERWFNHLDPALKSRRGLLRRIDC